MYGKGAGAAAERASDQGAGAGRVEAVAAGEAPQCRFGQGLPADVAVVGWGVVRREEHGEGVGARSGKGEAQKFAHQEQKQACDENQGVSGAL